MRFTHFTLMQDGHGVSSAAVMEQAVKSARICAEVTGESVTVVAHVEGGGIREAIFNPDGTIEWDHSTDGYFVKMEEERHDG